MYRRRVWVQVCAWPGDGVEVTPETLPCLLATHGLAAVRDDERGRSRSREDDAPEDHGRRRTAAELAAGVGGSVTAVKKGASSQKDAGPTFGGVRRGPSGAPRAWPVQGHRAEGPEGLERDGAGRVPKDGSRVAQQQRGTAFNWEGARCRRSSGAVLASCRGEGGEPTRGDRRRCVSARSRAVGSARARGTCAGRAQARVRT